jgi:hypothetical protein
MVLAALAMTFLAGPARSQQQECQPFDAIPSLASDDQAPAAQSDQDSKPSQNPPANQQQPDKNAQDKNAQAGPNGTSNDRLFYTLPNFLTVQNATNIPPMTTGQKFKAEVKSAFDPIQIVWYGFLAGLSQAENSEQGYGQGAEGYGKRYGAAAADGTIENFMVAAVMPTLFRQDPRFFQSGKGGFWHRTFYAWSRIVVTRGDNGNQQFNVSEVLGSALAAGISTYSYHPHSDKTLDNTLSVWGTQVGWDSLTYVIKEFWPDIRHWVRKKNAGSPSPSGAH